MQPRRVKHKRVSSEDARVKLLAFSQDQGHHYHRHRRSQKSHVPTFDCFQALCTSSFSEMAGTDVALATVSGSTDAALDEACCSQCTSNAQCKFWVRESGSSGNKNCWLKKDAGAQSTKDNRRGGYRQAMILAHVGVGCWVLEHMTSSKLARMLRPTPSEAKLAPISGASGSGYLWSLLGPVACISGSQK